MKISYNEVLNGVEINETLSGVEIKDFKRG